jgi:hypothetical protein
MFLPKYINRNIFCFVALSQKIIEDDITYSEPSLMCRRCNAR